MKFFQNFFIKQKSKKCSSTELQQIIRHEGSRLCIDFRNIFSFCRIFRCKQFSLKKFSLSLQDHYDIMRTLKAILIATGIEKTIQNEQECLSKAMSSLNKIQSFINVAVLKLNLKSITLDQLYSKLNSDTISWIDDIITIIMRQCAQDAQVEERKWVIFDEPVDAVQIENMNNVLDDNKKLFLTSGEIINMAIIFEVENLAVVSHAAVSRCGMVFLKTQQISTIPEKII